MEDERHFLLRCSAFSAQREVMFEEIKRRTGAELSTFDEMAAMRVLIGDQMSALTENAALRYINDCMRLRPHRLLNRPEPAG